MTGPWLKYQPTALPAPQRPQGSQSGPWEKYQAPVAEAPSELAADPIGRLLGLTGEQSRGLAQSVRHGLTLGTADEAAGLGHWLGGHGSFDEGANAVERERERFKENNPGLAVAGELVGSIPTFAIGGAGVARALQAGRGVMVPGAKAGALYGAALVPGQSNQRVADGVGDRVGKVVETAAFTVPAGAIGGAVGAKLGQKAGEGIEYLTDLARFGSAAQAPQAAARAMARDGVTPAQVRAQVMPATGRGAMTKEGMDVALRAYGDALSRGLDDAAARTAATNAYAASPTFTSLTGRGGRPLAARTARQHVNAAVQAWQGKNPVPLAIDEVATLPASETARAPTRGLNMQWQRRAAMNAQGEAREAFAAPVMARQEEALGRMRETVTRLIGRPEFDDAWAALVEANKKASAARYAQAQQVGLPRQLYSRLDALRRYAGSRGPSVADPLLKAINEFDDWLVAGGQKVGRRVQTLRTFIDARGALSKAITESYDKFNRPTPTTRVLTRMKKILDGTVRQQNPQWWDANIAHFEGKNVENAMQAGLKLNLKSGGALRAAMRWLRSPSTTQAEKDAMRLGVSRQLHDAISQLGDTHDATKMFLRGGRGSDEGLRGFLQALLGKKAASELYQVLQAERAAVRTFGAYGGSQTTPLREAMEEGARPSRALAALRTMLRPLDAIGQAGDDLAARITAARNRELAALYGPMTDNPSDFLRALDRIEGAQMQRLPIFTNALLPPASAGSVAGSRGLISTRGR